MLGVTSLGGFAEECVVEQSVRNLPLRLLQQFITLLQCMLQISLILKCTRLLAAMYCLPGWLQISFIVLASH